MKTGDIVRYARPEDGEENLRFRLLEINGDRVLIELICDWRLKPTETVALDEVATADE